MSINERVGNRLAILLERFHVVDPALFDAQEKANDLSRQFARSLKVNGKVGVL
jgi:hypothetical protein